MIARTDRLRAGVRASARFALLGLIALLAQPVQADDKDAVRRMHAERLAADGRCEEALDTLGPDAAEDARAGLLRGQCLIKLRRYGEAVDVLDAARKRDPDLPGIDLERGIALYHVGDLDAARRALAQARAAGSEDPRLDLYEGLLHLQQAELEEAAIALERARTLGASGVDPVASFYAGVAWAGLREREQAEASLRRVIEEDPDGPWGAEARRLLERRARTPGDGGPWALARLGMEYDSNVVLVRTSNLPQDISDKDGTRGTWYLEAGSELFREGDWSGGALVSYDGNAHIEDRVDEFDSDYPVASGWLDYQVDRDTRARLRYDVGFAWVDYDEFLFSNDVTLSGLRTWGRAGETELFVGFDYDNYLYHLSNDEEPLDRDGVGVNGGFRHYMPLLEDRVVGRVGYSVDRYWADRSQYDLTGQDFVAGFVAQLPLGISWDNEVTFRLELFDDKSIFEPTGSDRKDEDWEYETWLSKPITEYLIVSARYSYTDVNSNVSEFDYKRHIVGGYVTIRFR